MNKLNIVIVGSGMASHKIVAKMSEKSDFQNTKVTVFSEEPRPAYDRVHLTEYMSGRSAEDLSLAPLAWYESLGVDIHLGEKVININREENTVTSDKGTTTHYDKLILATGSYPFVPPIKGTDLKGVFVYRTIEDLEAIKEHAKLSKTGSVIGGGLLGLEAAKVLVDLGLETTVVEFADKLMARQIDHQGSKTLCRKIRDLHRTGKSYIRTSWRGDIRKA